MDARTRPHDLEDRVADVNYLVLAVVTRRFQVPLFWTLLEGSGNSATATRIALMRRYLAHFPAAKVRLLLADREFIGADWIKFLMSATSASRRRS